MKELKLCIDNFNIIIREDAQIKYNDKVLKGYISNYHFIYIKKKKYRVHKLVAQAFIGDVSNKIVDHIDRNPLNNHYTNLRIHLVNIRVFIGQKSIAKGKLLLQYLIKKFF